MNEEPTNDTDTKELFLDLTELPSDRWGAELETRVVDDARRRRVLRLLRAHESAGGLLEPPSELLASALQEADVDTTATEAQGDRIGRYRLIARIGVGGFGTVWRAAQLEPLRREVALKILKPGMDTEQVVARFAIERAALARMDHPGIAKVLDAGATEAGRPFFAMELVDGVPITNYCERERLDLRARLRLFVDVCLAVQHAHQKGVVHRDLKPTNVLVTRRDGEPAPVVIDFGIARVLHGDDVADLPSRLTEVRQLVGTPEYMSPEQALQGESDADTRADVYALGVLLYELLTGRRPFERRDAGPAAQDALLRQIVEAEPPRPSLRVDAVGGPVRRRDLRHELDWITLRALEKDRRRRYQTAAALAEDLERHLRDEPIAAGPPSTGYRIAKFVRRHRRVVTVAAVVVAALTLGIVAAVHGMLEARAGEARATQAAREAQLALSVLDNLVAGVDDATVRIAEDPVHAFFDQFERDAPARVAGEPVVEARIRTALGRTARRLGLLDRAVAHLGAAIALHDRLDASIEDRLDAKLEWTRVAIERGDVDVAERTAIECMHLCGALDTPRPLRAADVFEVLAFARAQRNRGAEAMALAQAALSLRRAGDDPEAIVGSLTQLAALHGGKGSSLEAERYLREAARLVDERLGPDHPDALSRRSNLAVVLQQQGRHVEAEAEFRAALAARRDLHGRAHPSVGRTMLGLGWLLHATRRNPEAAELIRSAITILKSGLGDAHPHVAEAINRLGVVTAALGDRKQAEELMRDAVRRFRTFPEHPVDGLAGATTNLANLLWESGAKAEAEELQREALRVAREHLDADHVATTSIATSLAAMCSARGDFAAAEALLRDALAKSSAAGRAAEAKLQRDRLAKVLDALGRTDEAAQLRANGGDGR